MQSLLLFLLLTMTAAYAQKTAVPEEAPNPDAMLLDATYVPCSDSTESLYIFRDGRAIYSSGGEGTIFSITGPLLTDLQASMSRTSSTVDIKSMDSCTTLGVILDGPRFLLINNLRPTPATRDLQTRLERLRKFGQRKLEKVERLTEMADEPADTSYVQPQPTIQRGELRRHVRLSPVAQEWHCRGSVVVAAKVGWNGQVREAFIRSAKVRGKCGALLAVAALRAVILTTFTPALNAKGKPTTGWMNIEVPFSGKM
jgi:hypothetical protein